VQNLLEIVPLSLSPPEGKGDFFVCRLMNIFVGLASSISVNPADPIKNSVSFVLP
jgi:hypothetical protein